MLVNGTRHFGFLGERESLTVRWHEIEQAVDPERVEYMKFPRYGTSVETMWYPHSTMPFIHTRDNIIEYNDMFDVANVMGDANAIYITACGPGNVFRRNFVHHLYGRAHQMAVRPDGFQTDFTFTENILWRCVFAGFSNQGPNTYTNNIVADMYPTNYMGMTWSEYCYFQIVGATEVALDGFTIERNIFYEPRSTAVFYRDHPEHRGWLEDCDVDHNLLYTAGDPEFSAAYLREKQDLGADLNGISADPLFVDEERGDFRLLPESPARALGFRDIPQGKIGLLPRWRARLLGGKIMRTYISPRGERRLRGGGEQISIECDQPDAVIHYTLDNTVPTTQSPVYDGPFRLERAAMVRARAFQDGYFDLYGDITFYLHSDPIFEDYEDLKLGDTSAQAYVAENSDQGDCYVTVVEGGPGDSERCLRFSDQPGGAANYNPHIFYSPDLVEGTAVLEYDIRLEAGSVVQQEWRDFRFLNPDNIVYPGPSYRFEDGQILAHGRPVAQYSCGEWTHIEVRVGLGSKADAGRWELTVTPTGGRAQRFELQASEEFRVVNWLGFSTHAETPASSYLDNVRLSFEASDAD
jgi:hypothetical protein